MLYTEEYLMSQFTFGFELEGFLPSDSYRKFVYFAKDFFKSSTLVDTSTINMDDDGSLREDAIEEPCYRCDGSGYETYTDEYGDVGECLDCEGTGYVRAETSTFEWNSPIFNVTPKNISDVMKFLEQCLNFYNVRTNDSCGFHIHLGFPSIVETNEGRLWLLLKLATNLDKLEELLTYEDIKLQHYKYAYPDFIYEINKIIEKYYLDFNDDKNSYKILALEKMYQDTKYRVLRQHPQGTLEWRGPRGFLDKNRVNIMKGFFKYKLYPFVKWISKELESNEIVYKDKVIFTIDTIKKFVANNEKITVKERKNTSKFELMFRNNIDRKHIGILLSEHPEMKNNDFYVYDINQKENKYIYSMTFRSGFYKNMDFGLNNEIMNSYKNKQFDNCKFGGIMMYQSKNASFKYCFFNGTTTINASENVLIEQCKMNKFFGMKIIRSQCEMNNCVDIKINLFFSSKINIKNSFVDFSLVSNLDYAEIFAENSNIIINTEFDKNNTLKFKNSNVKIYECNNDFDMSFDNCNITLMNGEEIKVGKNMFLDNVKSFEELSNII